MSEHSQHLRHRVMWLMKQFVPAFLTIGLGVAALVGLGWAQKSGWLIGESLLSLATNPVRVVYTCPMDPQIRQDVKGNCPLCGMPLVIASANGDSQDQFAVTIEPAQRRMANIRTATVQSKPVQSILRTMGEIAIDESRTATIAAFTDGRIEKMYADYTGVPVASGDHLAELYSPTLYAAQVEFIEASQTLSMMDAETLPSVRGVQRKLVENARQKLVELGMTRLQIEEALTAGEARSRLTLFAPIGGTVIEKLVEEGRYVTAGEPIYRVANLSMVWLMLELFPEDAARIRFGQRIRCELPSIPGEQFEGRVAFVAPVVDRSTRTVGVRAEFQNVDRRLRPGDYAQATIEIPIGPRGEVYDRDLAGKWISPMHPQVIRDQPGDCPICGMDLVPTSRFGFSEIPLAQPASLTIPRSAVLMAGRNSVVYAETEPGRFEIRPVKLGAILRDEVVIEDGLVAGEAIATSGNFLIDSQMQLAGKPSLIDPDRAVARTVRNTPLQFDTAEIQQVSGVDGDLLETLFESYFRIQEMLAADKLPSPDEIDSLSDAAGKLVNVELDDPLRKLLTELGRDARGLRDPSLGEVRIAFKPVSHAVIELASRVRSESASQAFHHCFCPMVKQGEGDWLQISDEVRNPYYGSQMLKCGNVVRMLPAETSTQSPAKADSPESRQEEVQD